MKKNLFNLIKIILLGVVVSFGASYLFAWSGNSSPPFNNTEIPLNISSEIQVKGTPRQNPNNALLDVVGLVSSNSLLVTNSAVFAEDLTLYNIPGNGDHICVEQTGRIVFCTAP